MVCYTVGAVMCYAMLVFHYGSVLHYGGGDVFVLYYGGGGLWWWGVLYYCVGGVFHHGREIMKMAWQWWGKVRS